MLLKEALKSKSYPSVFLAKQVVTSAGNADSGIIQLDSNESVNEMKQTASKGELPVFFCLDNIELKDVLRSPPQIGVPT